MRCSTCCGVGCREGGSRRSAQHAEGAVPACAQEANPKAEDVECLCKLLSTIGFLLDAGRGVERMEAYFLRLHRLKDNPTLEARHKFMIQARMAPRMSGCRVHIAQRRGHAGSGRRRPACVPEHAAHILQGGRGRRVEAA